MRMPKILDCMFAATMKPAEVSSSWSKLQDCKTRLFLDVNAETLKLYAITEGVDANNQRCGAAAAYTINPSNRDIDPTKHREYGFCTYLPHYIRSFRQNGYRIQLSWRYDWPISIIGGWTNWRDSGYPDCIRVPACRLFRRVRIPSFIDRLNRYAVACDLGLDRLFIYKL